MEWFSNNWVWVLFAGGMIAMHMFGHGGHGGHGARSDGGQKDSGSAGKDDVQPASKQSGHQH